MGSCIHESVTMTSVSDPALQEQAGRPLISGGTRVTGPPLPTEGRA